MFLLDNNMHKLYVGGDGLVVERVQANIERVWTSSVAVEEAMIGQLSTLNRARSPRTSLSLPQAHADFIETMNDLRILPIFVYSDEAEAIFRTFPAATIRIGPQDCRIAAQAMAHNLTVVTRNVRDFVAIGAPCVDWSGP